ncbi:hypothetical protein [Kitasatospora sp. HPMI-4]|uniref:hypothetical protein n=1 Tax=Kitasatospora sp. HPMI-4 TaxID=3448443 RepID=UPI003F1D0106
MDAEDLQITPTSGPSCEGVRDLIVELLGAHPLVTRVRPISAFLGEVGVGLEIGGLDFEIRVEPA